MPTVTTITDPKSLASLKELESLLEKPKYGSFKCAQCKAKEGCKKTQKCDACKSACNTSNIPMLFGGKRKTRRGRKGRKTRKQTRRRR